MAKNRASDHTCNTLEPQPRQLRSWPQKGLGTAEVTASGLPGRFPGRLTTWAPMTDCQWQSKRRGSCQKQRVPLGCISLRVTFMVTNTPCITTTSGGGISAMWMTMVESMTTAEFMGFCGKRLGPRTHSTKVLTRSVSSPTSSIGTKRKSHTPLTTHSQPTQPDAIDRSANNFPLPSTYLFLPGLWHNIRRPHNQCTNFQSLEWPFDPLKIDRTPQRRLNRITITSWSKVFAIKLHQSSRPLDSSDCSQLLRTE